MKTEKLIRKARRTKLFDEYKDEKNECIVFVKKGIWSDEYKKFREGRRKRND